MCQCWAQYLKDTAEKALGEQGEMMVLFYMFFSTNFCIICMHLYMHVFNYMHVFLW